MLRLARSFVTTTESAHEVLQDTWIAVLTGVAGFEGRSSVQTWVNRILVNTAKRRGLRESRIVPWSSWELTDDERGRPTVDPDRFQGRAEEYPGHWRAFPREWPTPETAALNRELQQRVSIAVKGLPGRQQVVLTLRDVEGHSADEVCGILDISAANQRVLLHRARAAVRADLEAYFESADQPAEPQGRG